MGRIWILIGKKEDEEKFTSLMIAQSENIQKEIVDDVYSMFNSEYEKQKEKCDDWDNQKEIRYNLDFIKSPQIAKVNSNSNTYMYQKGHDKI